MPRLTPTNYAKPARPHHPQRKRFFGKPTVCNMRYPVEMIRDLLSAEMTFEQLLADYPHLERAYLQACLHGHNSQAA